MFRAGCCMWNLRFLHDCVYVACSWLLSPCYVIILQCRSVIRCNVTCELVVHMYATKGCHAWIRECSLCTCCEASSLTVVNASYLSCFGCIMALVLTRLHRLVFMILSVSYSQYLMIRIDVVYGGLCHAATLSDCAEFCFCNKLLLSWLTEKQP